MERKPRVTILQQHIYRLEDEMRPLLLLIALLCLSLSACGGQTNRDPRVAEILTAPVPAGVDAQLWRELTRELARIASSRTASAPPVNAASATTLSYNDALGVLEWRYYFAGDYDQNGVVSVSDLSSLAVHLGESVSDVNTTAGVCDGDGNGQVTIADLTPIGVNLGRQVAGYRVYSAASESPYPAPPGDANGAGAQLEATLQLSEAVGDKGTQRLAFSYDNAPPSATTYFWVRPFDGADDGTSSNLLTLQSAENQAPIARLTESALGSSTPLKVNLSAGTSTDDHGIVKYEWDLDGDGIFEYDSGLAASTASWFYAPGTFTVSMRVTDAGGLRSTASKTIEVGESAKWHTQEVDEMSQNGRGTGLLVVEGRPAIFYAKQFQSDTGEFVYRRAGSDKPTSWSSGVVLAQPEEHPAEFVSAAMINGHPAVSFSVQVLSDRLPRYLIATDAIGTAWDSPVYIGPPIELGFSLNVSSLANIGGQPSFAYASDRLYFLRATNVNGSEWSIPLEIGVKSDECSMIEIGGSPGVAFYRREYGDLLYVSAEDPLGTLWPFPSMVDDQGFVGEDPALIEAAGFPAVVYYDDSFEAIKFTRALNARGTEWAEPIFLSKRTTPFQSIDKLPDGRLAVIFRTRDSELMWITSNDVEGKSWSLPTLISQDVALAQTPKLSCVGTYPYVLLARSINLVFAGYY
jgi:hypothetical protein